MEDEERRRMVVRRARRLRKMRLHDAPTETGGDYPDSTERVGQRSQRHLKPMLEDILPDSETDL